MPRFPLGGGVPKGTLGPVNGGNGPVVVTVTAGVEPAVIASLTVGITVDPTFVCGISLLFGGFASSSLLLAVLVLLLYTLPLLNNIQHSSKKYDILCKQIKLQNQHTVPSGVPICLPLVLVNNR